MAGEQPKKPAGGAYGRFLAEKRAEFQKECEGKPITAVTKLASERFKALSDDERADWQKKYEAAKEKYEKDMEAFMAAGGEKKARKVKGGKAAKVAKKKKDPQAPKKPTGGAYGCFLAKNRPAFSKECAGQAATAISKLAGERWKALGDAEKKPFEEEYAEKKAAYEEAKKSYVPLPGAEDDEDDEPPVKRARMSKEQKEAAKKDKAEEKEAAKKAKAAEKEAKAAAKTAKAAAPKAKAKAKAKAASGSGRGAGRGRGAGGRGRAAKAATPESKIELQSTVAAKAEKAGLTAQLLKLAAREDVAASGKSQAAMLKALEENNGLLHPAKRALLGA